MKRSSVVFASGVIFLGLGTSAFAADSGINLHQIYPAQNTRFMTVESPTLSPVEEDLAHLPELNNDYGRYYRDYYERLYLQLNFDYVTNPLATVDGAGTRTGKVVDSFGTMNLSAGYQLNPRVAVFGEVGVSHVTIDGASPIPTSGSSSALSDTRLIVKWLLNPPNDEKRSMTFALIPEIVLPTGNTNYFASNGSGVGVGLNLSAEKEWGKLSVSGNFGFRHSPDATYAQIDYRDQLPYALGILYRWDDSWGVVGEFTGAFAVTSSDFQNLAEIFAGPRWRQSRDWTFLAAAGTGHFKADMSNDFRGVFQVKYTPFSEPKALAPAPTPTPAPVVFVKPIHLQSEEFCPLESITFANNSIVMTEHAKKQLKDFAQRLNDTKKLPRIKSVQIQGHASPVGPLDHNQVLSEGRASTSKDFLVSLGVVENTVETRAYSQFAAPKGDFKTKKDKMNAWRRAEFFCVYEK